MNATLSWHPQRHRLVAAPIIAALAGVLLVGCGSSDYSSSGAGSAHDAAAPQRDDRAAEVAPDEYADESGVELNTTERSVVFTASMTVQVDDLDRAAADAKEWVRDADGYISAESINSTNSTNPNAQLTLKVPVDVYEQALEEFSALGSRKRLDRYSEDVTEDVADVDSRVGSAEVSLNRLRDLLEEAKTVEEVLKIEDQLSTRQSDLEALQSRQKALAELTSYGTVELFLALPSSVVPPADDDSPGFLGGLLSGWQALMAVVNMVILVIGWLLPFLALFAVLGLPLLWLRRRTRDRRKAVIEEELSSQPVAAAASGGPGESDGTDGDGPGGTRSTEDA